MAKTANTHNYVGIIDITLENIQISIYRYEPHAHRLQLDPHAQNSRHTGMTFDTNIEREMEQLILTAKTTIPEQKHHSTLIYLYGSGSYQLIPSDLQKTVLERAHQYMKRHSTFMVNAYAFEDMIITGQEQAALSWIAINYLETSRDTFSVLDISTFGINFAYGAIAKTPNATKITLDTTKYVHTNSWFDLDLDSISGCLPSSSNISVAGKENYPECQVMMNDIVKPFKEELEKVRQATPRLVEHMYLTNEFSTFYKRFNGDPKQVVEACNNNAGLDTDCAQGVLGLKLTHDLQDEVRLEYREISNGTQVQWPFARAILHAYTEQGNRAGIEVNGTLRFGDPGTRLTFHLIFIAGVLIIAWLAHRLRNGPRSYQRIKLGDEVEMNNLNNVDI